MAGGVEIRIAITADRFPDIAARLPDIARALTMKAAFDIEAEAKARAPVDTGYLKNSIQAKGDPDDRSGAMVIVGAEYGIYVEYGTRHMPPRPYFHPAIQKVAPSFEEACRIALRSL